ncbi:MAG: MFS transporter [Desulfobacca sp.]|uniref:MFS transporter n=1 Tax=Desulfobacca sp. TaxID=2067990 RepID=UPI004049A3A0
MPFALLDTFASFRHRNYRLFFLGQTISLVGSWMQAVAQGWLVLILTDSSLMLGLAGALHTLPLLLFSFCGGVVADQTDKRRLLLATNGAGLAMALTLGLLIFTEIVQVWQILVLLFGIGATMAFDIPGRQSFIVELVGKDDLPNAIALNSSLFNGTRALGPAFAGMLIASVGIANCFFLNALSYVAPLICLTLLRLPPRLRPQQRLRTIAGTRELFAFIARQRPELGWIMAILAVNAVFALSYTVLMPIIARDILQAGPKGYGFLMAASGVGAFCGALVLAGLIRRYPPMPFFWSGTALMLSALFLLSGTRSFWLALVFLFFTGFGMTTAISTGNSLVQLHVPDEMRGRIMSLFGLTFLGFTPLGNLLYGLLSHYVGPGLTIRLGTGLAALLVLSCFLARPELRRLRFTTTLPKA